MAYYLPWCFAYQLGLVTPSGNMRYYAFVENDAVMHIVYWPMMRLTDIVETTRWGAHHAIYWRDRQQFGAVGGM